MRRLHERLDPVLGDRTDVNTRLAPADAGQSPPRPEMTQHAVLIAALNARMDRFDERLGRLERRLDLLRA